MKDSNVKKSIVLVAEDDPDDRFFITEAFEGLGVFVSLKLFEDGQKLLDFINGCYCVPDLIILDLNMPVKNGFETLAELKANSRTKDIPVVVLTTSGAPEHEAECSRLGASDFFLKAATYAEITEGIRTIIEKWIPPGPAQD